MKTLFFFFFSCIVSVASAQISLSISAGYDPNEINLYNKPATDGNNAYWNKGFSVGLNSDYSLNENLFFSALFQYSHYRFDRFVNAGVSIPEISFISAQGEDSKLFRASVEAKYFLNPQNRFRFFIFSGVGILKENLGSVKTEFSDMNKIGLISNTINSEDKTFFVHSLGAGVRTAIISSLFVDTIASYYSDYNSRFQMFLGLNLGYQLF